MTEYFIFISTFPLSILFTQDSVKLLQKIFAFAQIFGKAINST